MATLSGYIYHCSAGETFDSIALYVYDDSRYAADLLNANPGYATVMVFGGGEVLSLPVVEAEADNGGGANMPTNAPWKEG